MEVPINDLYTIRWAIRENRPEIALDQLATLLGEAEAPPPADGPEPVPPGMLKVCLVVGHNSHAQGATAGGAMEGLSEFEVNNAVADYLVDQSDSEIAFIKLNRTQHRSYGTEIDEVYQAAARLAPDLIVEMHFNAGGGDYACCLAPAIAPNTQAIAHRFAAVFAEGIGANNAGVKKVTGNSRGGRGIHATKVPSVLCEPFFGDNEAHVEAVAAMRVDGLGNLYLEGCRQGRALLV